MLYEGNQIHNFISSSGSGTVINYGSGSDFLISYGSGSVPLVKKLQFLRFRFRFWLHNTAPYVMLLMRANPFRLSLAPNGTCLTARCHFTGPKKVSFSRAQAPPTCPSNGFARIKSIMYRAVSIIGAQVVLCTWVSVFCILCSVFYVWCSVFCIL